jgi:transcriptional regulator GlxA family with amidase domain
MLLMEQKLSAPQQSNQLALELAISKRQLERLFRKELGASLQTFGRDMRLSYAVWLMTHADSRLSDVAAHCGFSDAAHFSRIFRAAFGTSPVPARKRGAQALQQMLERWWPYGGLPGAGTANGDPRPAPADRRPYL